jgi:hypothetical protein
MAWAACPRLRVRGVRGKGSRVRELRVKGEGVRVRKLGLG